MSSGKAITKPSDDPYAAGRAISLRSELAGIKQHERNVEEAQGWMTVTSTALSQITDMAQTARQLVVQGATDTLPQESRNAIADQIDQLIAGMKQEANATYDGRYVLGGNRTNVRPYDATATTDPSVPTNDAYAGDSANQLREIGPNVTMVVNVHGDEVLGGAPGATGDMLGVMRDIATHLRSGDTAALGNGRPKGIQGQIDNLLGVQARRRRGYEPPRHRVGAPAGDRGVDDVDALEHRGRRHGRDARQLLHPAGRLPVGAERRRAHRPDVAARLPPLASAREPHDPDAQEHEVRRRRARPTTPSSSSPTASSA